jgi:hypothetical protein
MVQSYVREADGMFNIILLSHLLSDLLLSGFPTKIFYIFLGHLDLIVLVFGEEEKL